MPEGEKSGIAASLARALDTALATVQNRLELFSVELREEKYRLVELLVLAGGILALALMALALLTFTIVFVLPEEARVMALIGLTLIYAVAIGLGIRTLRARLKSWVPFSGTLGELQKDRACLANWRNCESANKNS